MLKRIGGQFWPSAVVTRTQLPILRELQYPPLLGGNIHVDLTVGDVFPWADQNAQPG
jgi:hypothetical protein